MSTGFSEFIGNLDGIGHITQGGRRVIIGAQQQIFAPGPLN